MSNILKFNAEISEWIEDMRTKFPQNASLAMIQNRLRSAWDMDSSLFYINTCNFWLNHKEVLCSCDYARILKFVQSEIDNMTSERTLQALDYAKVSTDDVMRMFHEFLGLSSSLTEKERKMSLNKLKKVVMLVQPL
jgi:hypothetical protein